MFVQSLLHLSLVALDLLDVSSDMPDFLSNFPFEVMSTYTLRGSLSFIFMLTKYLQRCVKGLVLLLDGLLNGM